MGSGVFNKPRRDGYCSVGRRSSIIYDSCVRFDELKAIGVSRHLEKHRVRARVTPRADVAYLPAQSTGRIHADKTLDTYKGIALRYVQWARRTQGVCRLDALDARAPHLVALYLDARLRAGDSAHSLQTIRSALRMFHRPAYPAMEREACVRRLGAEVALPIRHRAGITRSRVPVAMDQEIALDRYRPLIAFCRATGLRRRELAALTVGDICADADGGVVVDVHNGKGGKYRAVPVLPGREDDVVILVLGRPSTDHVIARVPTRLDIHAYRRAYAQDLYREGGRRGLPSPTGRLTRGSVDTDRALYVARALGHERIDVVLRHYLR